MARFRPLAIPLTPPLDGADADAREWDFFNEVLWHMQIPCCLLPDMRPALLAGVQLGAEEEASVRESWLQHYNLSLPEVIGSYYRVRFSTDPDEPAGLVPSCCVWTENGLCTTPASAANGSAEAALCQLAGT
ncbi:hypothetical protein CVIRNUC_007881 [Coccomyxa viridis]|uniref:Uncharacterized protein n=1 Tax=Coccomyxa viridis TaxID=1274662 RepID=A0AAV1IEQ9_9CHLO|nr:hypothetical protein CVIRNUC_007881 [Coccomyxa viridis]